MYTLRESSRRLRPSHTPPRPLSTTPISNFGGTAGGNASFWQARGESPLKQDPTTGDWSFSVWVGLNDILTVTTSAALYFPMPTTAPPPPAPFPTSYDVDWSSAQPQRGPGAPAWGLSEINGAFEFLVDPVAGRGLAATAAAAQPLSRYGTDTVPHAIIGDQQWSDVDVSARWWPGGPADGALLGVRCSGLNDGDNQHVTGMDALPGLWLSLNASGWALVNRLDAGARVLARGLHAQPLALGAWHAARLIARGSRLIARVDGLLLASVDLAAAGGVLWQWPASGFVGLGAQALGGRPLFGGLTIAASASACSAPPALGHAIVEETCSLGAPGQAWMWKGTPTSPGPIVSAVNASLCIAMNRESDPPAANGDANARDVYVALCNATEPRQMFAVERTTEDGPYNFAAGSGVGAIQGPDGFTMNIVGDSDEFNTRLCGYTWQGASNAMWVVVAAPTPYIYAPYYARCLSSCENVGV